MGRCIFYLHQALFCSSNSLSAWLVEMLLLRGCLCFIVGYGDLFLVRLEFCGKFDCLCRLSWWWEFCTFHKRVVQKKKEAPKQDKLFS